MEYHEERRLTATEAIQDKWFTSDNERSSNTDSDNVFNFCDLSDALKEIRKQLARKKLITTVKTLMKFNTISFRKRKSRVNPDDDDVNEKKIKEDETIESK